MALLNSAAVHRTGLHVPTSVRRGAAVAVACAAAAFLVPAGAAAAQGDTYVSNPPEDRSLIGYCQDQATLANNLVEDGDQDRALDVVGAANIRGCRIYTFGTV